MQLKTTMLSFLRKHQRAIWVALAVFPFVYVFTPAIYFGKELRAQVVDSETLRPVAGVQVEARWTVIRPTLNLESHSRRLHEATVTSDENGFFVIPGWGPLFEPRWYRLYYDGPSVVLKKTRYEDRLISRLTSSNDSAARVWLWKTISAQWNGVRIKLYRTDAAEPLRAEGGDPY